jgi:thiamine-phosphate pyrophosphorylase
VRERSLEGAGLLAFASDVASAARRAAQDSGREVRVLVNKRADVALAISADGVHLGFDSINVEAARRILGPDALVGVSTHSAAEVENALDVSYVHLAPIFAPISKATSRPPLGLATLASAARQNVAVIAQGGVTAQNADAVCVAGAAGVAVTGAILLAPDPAVAAAALRRALDRDSAMHASRGAEPGFD